MKADLRLGRWEVTLSDVTQVDCVITDPPYGARTHASQTTRNDGHDDDGLTPDYPPWTADDVHEFVQSWSPRTRGWMVCLTDDSLIDAYRAAYRAVGRFDFHPVPCVINGMSCRLQGDGPSSEAVYAMISRPRTEEWIGGWTRRGRYIVDAERVGRRGKGRGVPSGKGRGKPSELEHALVRDYSLPGWTVCDPLFGYGGTLKAALALGRKAVGAELDPEAYADAVRRLKRPLQVDLFPTSGGQR